MQYLYSALFSACETVVGQKADKVSHISHMVVIYSTETAPKVHGIILQYYGIFA